MNPFECAIQMIAMWIELIRVESRIKVTNRFNCWVPDLELVERSAVNLLRAVRKYNEELPFAETIVERMFTDSFTSHLLHVKSISVVLATLIELEEYLTNPATEKAWLDGISK
jgi:hypothetical protein